MKMLNYFTNSLSHNSDAEMHDVTYGHGFQPLTNVDEQFRGKAWRSFQILIIT